MSYLNESDIRVIIYDEELQVLKNAINEHFDKAEASTVDFFKGYLRTRYDVDTLFTEWDGANPPEDPRPAALITKMSDHLLCILYRTQPDRMIPEHRMLACDDAKAWLEAINSGQIDPGFPIIEDEDGNDTLGPIQFGSNNKVSSNW